MSTTDIQKSNVIDFDTVSANQVEIPATSSERYITGIYALNIPAPEGTTGDWHDVFYWRQGIDRPRTILLGGGDEVDTNAVYGDLGVYEGRAQLVAKGLTVPVGVTEVYVANHFRAILDLVYRSLRRYGRVLNLRGATTDWLDTPEQQQYVLDQAARLSDVLDEPQRQALAAWIAGERREAA
jgi:hypothetical protein